MGYPPWFNLMGNSMTLEDYLEEHRRALKSVHQQMATLERTATTLLLNINHIKRVQYQQELAKACTKPTQE